MSMLRLRLQKYLDGDRLPGIIYAELSGTGIKGSRSIMLPVGENVTPHYESVGPGRYLLQVTLPSGEFISRDITVTGTGDVPVDIRPPASAHEYTSWPQFLGLFRSDLSDMARGARLATASHLATAGLRRGMGAPNMTSFGILPITSGGTVQEISQGEALAFRLPNVEGAAYDFHAWNDEENFVFRFTPSFAAHPPEPFHGPSAFVVDGLADGPLTAMLPLPWTSSLDEWDDVVVDVVLHQALEGVDSDRPRLAVALRDPMVGALLGYLAHGRLPAVQSLAENFLQDAELMLKRKRRNPYAAAAGALVLLRMQCYERLHDWPFYLADWFPWLSDGAVLAGWCCLLGLSRKGERWQGQNPQIARQYFLQAAGQVPPIFTDSLRLLVDGLKRCLSMAEAENRMDSEIRTALTRMRGLARSVESRQPVAVFRGPEFLDRHP